MERRQATPSRTSRRSSRVTRTLGPDTAEMPGREVIASGLPVDTAVVTFLQKPIPVGLLARCLPADISRARNGFWASENELVVTFKDKALVCHPASPAQLQFLCSDADLSVAQSGWLVEDQNAFQVWLEYPDDQVRVLHPPARDAGAVLKLLAVSN